MKHKEATFNKYQQSQDHILSQLLADKNLSSLSRRMGFKFNKVLRWQNNTKLLKWSEFVDLCSLLKIPLSDVMRDTFGLSIITDKDLKNSTVKLLAGLRSSKKQTAKSIGKSLPTLHRIQKSKTSPNFQIVLALMDQRPQYLSKFQQSLLAASKRQKAPRSIFSLPWMPVVSSIMALKQHQQLPEHSDNWIADQTGLTIAQVKETILVMVENELIEKHGSHYRPTLPRTLAISHQRSREEFQRILRYWTERALLQSDKAPVTPGKSFFRIFATTPEAAQEITNLMFEFEERAHNILSRAEGEKTEVRFFVMHHLAAIKQP